MSFGNSMPGNIAHLRSKERGQEILNMARAKAQKIIEENAIDIRTFPHHRDMQKDLDKIKHYKNLFGVEDDAKKAATIFEAIILERSELDEWLGPDVKTIKTSEYDDFINGTDLVAEFGNIKNGFSHLALGVDVTFGKEKLRAKFERILEEIETDELAKIKYFRSENLGFEGTLHDIPRVVIGISKEEVLALSRLWLTNNKKSLAIHPIQHALLEQIHRQLSVFGTIAYHRKKRNAVERYNRARQIIEKIRESKGESDLEGLENDPIHQLITNEINRLS